MDANNINNLSKNYRQLYEQKINSVWLEVVRLNSNIFCLKVLKDFPFDVLDEWSSFWRITFENFIEMSIISIWKLAIDSKKDSLTLLKLKNEILKNIIDAEYKDYYRKRAKKVKFDNNFNKLSESIKLIRNKKIAHFDEKFNVSADPDPSQIPTNIYFIDNLDSMLKQINNLFQCISIDMGRGLLFPSHAIRTSKYLSDVDKVLLSIAMKNDLLNMPEEQPGYWPTYKEGNVSKEKLNIINTWRQKIGKEPV